ETAELAAVAAGAAQAGGDADDLPGSEAALEAEALAADVIELPDEELAEDEEFAAEVSAEAEDEADTQSDDASADVDEAESVGGVGAVEGEDVVEAEAAAGDVHDAAIENAQEAATAAEELSAEAE